MFNGATAFSDKDLSGWTINAGLGTNHVDFNT